MRPFLFQDRHEDKVELIEEGPLCFQFLFRLRVFDDAVDDKVTNP